MVRIHTGLLNGLSESHQRFQTEKYILGRISHWVCARHARSQVNQYHGSGLFTHAQPSAHHHTMAESDGDAVIEVSDDAPRHAAVGHAASSSTDAHAEQPGKRLRVSFSTSASADEVDVRGGHARHVLANSANNIGAPQTTPGPHLAANLSANSVVTCPFSYLNGR